MKLVIAALLVSNAAATIAAGDNRLANVDAAGGSVQVSAFCTGLDSRSLSAKALAYSAKALEVTFNTVFDKKGPEAVSKVTANSPFTVYEDNSNKKNGLRGTTTWLGGSGCRNCPKDDDQALTETGTGLSFTMIGGAICRNCPKDDDGASILVHHQADWEVEFAAVLSKAPYAALAGIQKCSIIYNDDDAKIAAIETPLGGSGCRNCPKDDDAVKEAMPVILHVKCDQFDFAEISHLALLNAAKTLEETYNAIHRFLNDETSLEGIAVEYGPRFSSVPRSFGGSKSMEILGGSGCRNCPKDDNLLADEEDEQQHDLVVAFTAISRGVNAGALVTDHEALKAWEDMFVASLIKGNNNNNKQSGGDSFQQVGQCMITMSAATFAEAME